MKSNKLVASFLCALSLGAGCLGRDDGVDPYDVADIRQEVGGFTEKNGTRLKAVSGWKCGDGAQSVNGLFFDTKTGAACGPAWPLGGNWPAGPYYCAPGTRLAEPATDVPCSRVVNP
jgi:hypothetical protein